MKNAIDILYYIVRQGIEIYQRVSVTQYTVYLRGCSVYSRISYIDAAIQVIFHLSSTAGLNVYIYNSEAEALDVALTRIPLRVIKRIETCVPFLFTAAYNGL